MTNEVEIDEMNVSGQYILSGYDDLMSVADLSKLLNVSKQTIYKEIKNGKFGKVYKLGRETRIPKLYILEKYFTVYQERL